MTDQDKELLTKIEEIKNRSIALRKRAEKFDASKLSPEEKENLVNRIIKALKS